MSMSDVMDEWMRFLIETNLVGLEDRGAAKTVTEGKKMRSIGKD